MKEVVFASNLPKHISEEAVRSLFIPFGPISRIVIPKEKHNAKLLKGFAFIEYEDEMDAKAACENLECAELNNRIIHCVPSNKNLKTHSNLKSAVWDDDKFANILDDAAKLEEAQLPSDDN